ncbi:hypothetical protein J0A94_03735 [Paraclostridium bifermentans]|uniref:DUF2326 domain-containing protein n=1 Tax=Paraclostridium bifermentans TaxID=1490 RepID=A0AA44DJX3_PARBF|nr:DUF2326 domain-containing protein [Paraclostridium bifermentans]MBN8046927.1 hypothetical protein [Paraclostridium bifermentans]NME09001.1 hypothetical protein [Paraclostridium bifermentans]
MLKEIKSKIFRIDKIEFHQGLNIVVGDDCASNSIGKSTLLMIIDFIYGGNTYITYNKDVVKNMGEHEFLYSFEFDNNIYKFIRTTADSENVYKCDDDYNILKSITLDEYTKFLKEMYKIDNKYSTFRSLVSLYSRIWGKNNYDIDKPLNVHNKSKDKDMINNLIKLFSKYEKIDTINKNIKQYTEENKAITKASSFNYIPNITKKKYKENILEISNCENEVAIIKENLNLFSINLIEISNKDLIKLNEKKISLSNRKSKYISKLNKISLNQIQNKRVDQTQFDKLVELFPEVNVEKLEEIENFHVNICKYLKKEIKEEIDTLKLNIEIIDDSLKEIDTEIKSIINATDAPQYILDKIVKLSSTINQLKDENKFYDEKIKTKENLKYEKDKLERESKEILDNIEKSINDKMEVLYKEIIINPIKSPSINLNNNGYKFNIYDNTGTGNAYSSLIILDLSILSETNLPFIIHDTMLFKNIEKYTVEKLISIYNSFNKKQVFIAIDEVYKYDEISREIIDSKKVIELDRKNTLFEKVWNKGNLE